MSRPQLRSAHADREPAWAAVILAIALVVAAIVATAGGYGELPLP